MNGPSKVRGSRGAFWIGVFLAVLTFALILAVLAQNLQGIE